MPYNYDYFISYAHADNKSEDGKPGFVDEFVNKLRDSEEHQRMFGRKTEVFFDKSEIKNMSDWDNRIRSSLASSRFLIVLLSPGYFKSEYCAREFDWWMQHEMHRRLLGEGTAPMLIVDVSKMYDYQLETIPDIPEDIQARFPNWLSQIRKIQSGPQFDMHDLDRVKISEALDSLRNEVKDKVKRQDAAEKAPHTGQYPRYNEDFVGRRENLRSLRKSLSEKTAATYSALTGLGGFGKTELALTYGHAFAWDYQLGLVFAKCENKTSLTDILLTSGIAEMNGWELPKGSEEQQITFLFSNLKTKRDELVQRNKKEGNLATLGAHILLILDNVNKLELISKKNLTILPDFFHVIITTRENVNEFPHIHSEPVERLSEDESVELLSNLHPFANVDEANAARNIAKLLAGFTLAVELTGAYLNKKKHTTYQKQYEQLINDQAKAIQTIADKTGDLTRHDAQTVAAVLESTFSALSPNARKALNYAAIMAPDTVALAWLPELLGLDEDDGWEVHDELVGYSLLTPLENEPNIARMHSLVAQAVKKKLSEDVQKKINAKIRGKCNALLEKGETFWCTSENSWNIIPVSEFFLSLAEQWTMPSSEEEIDWSLIMMLLKSGKTLITLGKIKEAREVFQQNLIICNKLHKTFPSNCGLQYLLSSSYAELGDIEKDAGNIAAARMYYDKTLEILLKLALKRPTNIIIQDLCASYERLGDLEQASGNTTAARNWFEKTIEIHMQLANLIPDNVNNQRGLSITYNKLGDLEKTAGNTVAARDWYVKTMEIAQRLANKMPDDVNTQRDLCASYYRIGDMELSEGNSTSAREWYEKVLDINQRLAKMMPENVVAQQMLCVPYYRLGDMERSVGNSTTAREWYDKGMEIAQQLVDKMPDDVTAQRGLSISYERIGFLEQAAKNFASSRDWFMKAHVISKRLADKMPDNVDAQHDLSISYGYLGELENAAGNTAAARECYKKLLEIIKPLADRIQDNIDIQRNLSVAYERLGILELVTGNLAAAREFFEKALENHLKLADKIPENVDYQRLPSVIYFFLGDLENAVGNKTASREWYEKLLRNSKWLASQFPNDNAIQRDLSISYERIGNLEKADGNVSSAREWFEKALKIAQQLTNLMSDDDAIQRDLSDSYGQIGNLEKDAGNFGAAREWFEKALDISQQIVDKMPENVTSQRNLSEVYFNLGSLEFASNNAAKAKEWCNKALTILEQVIDKIPHDVESQKILGNVYRCLGDSENADGNIKTAQDWYEKALNVFQQLANRIPDNVQVQKELAETQNQLAKIQIQP